MKKVAIILAVMLVFGIVFISGCTTTPSNTTVNNTGQNKSGIPGYCIGQIVNIEWGSNINNVESGQIT